MGTCYFEARQKTARGNSISTDMMRHLHTRQYLGKALVITDQPTVMLSASRKQWLKLSRYIQKQRAATLDADKILKYTHAVTHMQHLRFSAKPPLDSDADVYFLSANDAVTIPTHCQTVYLASSIPETQVQTILAQLSSDTLLVDYTGIDPEAYGLRPKHDLETAMQEAWLTLGQFLDSYHIHIKELAHGTIQKVDTMEEALDILLGASNRFLQLASNFQRTLELARPLRLQKSVREQYDAAILLAHRVQALSTATYTQQFLEVYNEDDTFFLYDRGRMLPLSGETLAEAVARQLAAGRHHLAAALQRYARSTS